MSQQRGASGALVATHSVGGGGKDGSSDSGGQLWAGGGAATPDPPVLETDLTSIISI